MSAMSVSQVALPCADRYDDSCRHLVLNETVRCCGQGAAKWYATPARGTHIYWSAETALRCLQIKATRIFQCLGGYLFENNACIDTTCCLTNEQYRSLDASDVIRNMQRWASTGTASKTILEIVDQNYCKPCQVWFVLKSVRTYEIFVQKRCPTQETSYSCELNNVVRKYIPYYYGIQMLVYVYDAIWI